MSFSLMATVCPSCRWQTLAWARWVKGWWTVTWRGSTSPPPAARTSTWHLRSGRVWATQPRQTSSLSGSCSGPSWRGSPSSRRGPRRNNWVWGHWIVSPPVSQQASQPFSLCAKLIMVASAWFPPIYLFDRKNRLWVLVLEYSSMPSL